MVHEAALNSKQMDATIILLMKSLGGPTNQTWHAIVSIVVAN